ncbi:MAG: VOC family protein [Nocardioidaceae bacterium]
MQMVHVFIDVPAAQIPVMSWFWSAALGWRPGQPWERHPEFTNLEPPVGDTYVSLQTIAEGGPRIHVDFAVPDVEAARDRLAQLGADVGDPGDGWQVMASPGGMPFCLFAEAPTFRCTPAVAWPEGHHSRLAQVSIDSPAALHERERDFWVEATGWAFEPPGRSEFDGKLFPPDGGTVRLLLQRLGSDDPGTQTRAHLDLGTDDVAGEVERVRRLGAAVVGAPPGVTGWVALTDPAGMSFCVTGNSPDPPGDTDPPPPLTGHQLRVGSGGESD